MNGDWDAPLNSLTLPPFAGPNDGAIILDPQVSGCLSTRYDAVIIWRAPNPSFRGQYFMGVVKAAFLPSGTTAWIERGFMLNDPDVGTCWVYIRGRIESNFDPIGGNTFSETVGDLGQFGVGVPVSPTDFVYDIRGDAYVHSKFITTENDTQNGPANANTFTGSTVFSNYPTNVQCNVTKLGGLAETCFKIEYDQTFYVDNPACGPLFGVNVNGPSGSFNFITHQVPPTLPGAFVRLSSAGMVKTFTVPMIEGAYVFTPLWARVGAVGNIFANTNDDWTSLSVTEVTL